MAVKKTAKTATPPPLAHLVDKDITDTIDRLCTYVTEQTGYEPDPMSVSLGSALRAAFQKSDGNQAVLAARAAAREKAAAKAVPVAQKAVAPTRARAAAKTAPVPEPVARTATRRRPAAKEI